MLKFLLFFSKSIFEILSICFQLFSIFQKVLLTPQFYLSDKFSLQNIRVQVIMDNPIKATIQLSKEEKLKKLNQKLNYMLKSKNVDPLKVVPETIGQIKNQHKPLASEQKQKSLKTKEQNDEIQEKQAGEKDRLPEKNKPIKKQEKKQVKTLRKAAGEVWEDKTMEDWPDNDYRIFCGNLGNQVNDQILASVFKRYASFQMARVVRDRRTGKTRGYGFVSFTNANDFLNALKQINGKHVGNRPVKLTKSSWKDRDLNSEKNQLLPSDFKKNAQKQTHKINIDYKYVSSL